MAQNWMTSPSTWERTIFLSIQQYQLRDLTPNISPTPTRSAVMIHTSFALTSLANHFDFEYFMHRNSFLLSFC